MAENNQTNSNGRGGRRVGAGRKPGTANRKTREIADKAAATGITPLEVMLFTMNAMMAEANAIINEQREGGKEVTYPLGLLQDAAAVAKDAAPYMHPKLSSVEMNAKVNVKTLDQELADLNEAHPDAAGGSEVA